MYALSFLQSSDVVSNTDSLPEKYGGRPTCASIDRNNAFIAETYRMHTHVIPPSAADS